MKITVTAGAGTFEFDRLIVASGFQRAWEYLDETPEERELMSRVRTVEYKVTVFRARGLTPNRAIFFAAHTTPDRAGEVTAMVNRGNGDIWMAYQVGTGGRTPEELREAVWRTTRRLGGQPREVLLERRWDYFPHVASEDVRDGYYRRFDDRQGVEGTYYTGGLARFETTNDTALAARELVSRFFRRGR